MFSHTASLIGMSEHLCIQSFPLQSFLRTFVVNQTCFLAELVRLNKGLDNRGSCWSCQEFDVGALLAYWQGTPCGCCLISNGNLPNVCWGWNLCTMVGMLLSLPSRPSFSHWQPARCLFSGSELFPREVGHVIRAGVPTLFRFCAPPPTPFCFFLVTALISA